MPLKAIKIVATGTTPVPVKLLKLAFARDRTGLRHYA